MALAVVVVLLQALVQAVQGVWVALMAVEAVVVRITNQAPVLVVRALSGLFGPVALVHSPLRALVLHN